jgi:DMSO/TMAO reductase YedYZ molybdopterin-dependent catalytic subunit
LPLRANTADVLERVSLVPLVGGSIFMLFTGTANIARWYPWRFFFPRGHYWVAWVTIGALIVHIGARQASARAALARGGASAIRSPAPAADRAPAIGRRALLAWAGAASAGLTLTTAGQTVGFLRAAVKFAPRRPDIGTQGLPVNKAAGEAGVEQSARDPNWRLVIEAEGEERLALDLVQLEALPRRRAELPIACVEGWSRSASWSGVPMRDLLDRVQVASYDEVDVISLEDGLYGRSTLSARQVRDRDTMLALELNGERLNLDHGYPVRLITPNRPGVLQTKWVTRLVVR